MNHPHDMEGLPVTSGGYEEPEAGASWSASGGCGHGASAGCDCVPGVVNAQVEPGAAGDGAAAGLEGDVVETVRVGPYRADVQLQRRDGGLWVACAMISTERGIMSWCGAATEQEVAAHLANRRRRLASRSGTSRRGAAAGFDFGRFLNDMGREIERGARQLARNRTLRRVVRDVSQTLNRPELQPVMAVVQQIPYLGQAVGAVRAAATLADQVLGGNRQARGRLANIRRAAQQGNPIARQALEVLNDVLSAQQRSARQRAGAPPRGRARSVRGRRRPARSRSRGRSVSGGQTHDAPTPEERAAWRAASARWREHVSEHRPVVVTPPPS